jgi:UDP-glucuronate 4-epimerase
LFGDGSAQRDWTFYADTVSGVIAAIDRPFDYEVINLGNHKTQTEMDLIRAAENATGKKAEIIHLERPPSEPPITYADISKAQKLLDFAPTTPFSQGYPLFFEWYEREGRYF